MNERINDAIGNMENYKVRDFKKAMQKYEGESFTLYVPKSKKNFAILKSAYGYYQVSRYAMLCRIGDAIYSDAYSIMNGNVLRNYDEFEERLEEEDFTEYGICMNKKMTGICAVNEEEILSEGEKGYFLCALTLLAEVKSTEEIQYALFAYNPENHKYSKLNYYKIDEALFDLIFEFTKMAGDSYGRC